MVPSEADTAYIVKNLYCLYLHDLSRFNGALPNRHGILEPNESIRDLVEQGDIFSQWWSDPDGRFPFLIMAGELPAGFAFVVGKPHTPEDADFWMYEFFLLYAFRGRGMGEAAAADLFGRFRGRWGLTTFAQHIRAQRFWEKTLKGYNCPFSITPEPSPYGDSIDRVFFRFENTKHKPDKR